MSAYALGQHFKEIKYDPFAMFSIQFDESTDIANCSQLPVYKRYINDGSFKNELLYANLLKQWLLHMVSLTQLVHLKEQKISYRKVCGLCTDGAPAMLEYPSGFQCLVLNESPTVIRTHYMIHWQILAMKKLATKIARRNENHDKFCQFVRVNTLNSQLFLQLCHKLGGVTDYFASLSRLCGTTWHRLDLAKCCWRWIQVDSLELTRTIQNI